MRRRKSCSQRFVIFLLLVLSACGLYQKGGTYVWIDVPVSGINLPNIQPIKIEGHASSPGGIKKVEILINTTLFTTIDQPPAEGDLASFQTVWSPLDEGEYIIQVIAYGNNNAESEFDSARIMIGGDLIEATPQITHSMTPTHITPETSVTITATAITKTLTPTSTLTPRRPTPTATPTRTPIPHTATPTKSRTPPDFTPPPPPTPFVPADGLSLSCRSTQSLVWLPVTDPSGIAEYRVEIQRSSDNEPWTNAPGSPINGLTDKTTQISTDCGWYYRWHVRAIDTARNMSEWSSWSYFAITLD